MELYEETSQYRAEVERHRENKPRLANAYARFMTTGQGSIEFEKRIDFGLTFIERPYVAYGTQIDLDDLDDLLGKESEDNGVPALPMCSGLVTEWDQDERDFYVGCWVACRVWFPPDPPVPADIPVEVYHDFTFQAIAMKDVPLDVRN